MPTFSVILVGPKYPGNIGAVARIMKNFGLMELILLNPAEREISKKARIMATHAQDVLNDAITLDSFDALKERFDFLIATTAVIGRDKNPLRTPILPEQLETAVDLEGKIGLVFGREDHGLSNEEIEMCDLLVTIRASSDYPTLNVSQAVAIILYEISKLERKGIGLKKFRKADKIEKGVLLEKFNDLVDAVGLEDFRARIAKKTFKSLIGRAFISGREAFTLTGVFRRASERIKGMGD
ncbi:MAG: hypothetical protein A7316_00965 [Candidatus Altiarchaeales archaeon WOR_SM1_86-2]|nr:MAG: hypothetical protein A7316_00965 [Candidatus Altiarchaeales archaeon WOR_SM1_86-2]